MLKIVLAPDSATSLAKVLVPFLKSKNSVSPSSKLIVPLASKTISVATISKSFLRA